MKYEDLVLYMIELYINNEIEFIEQEMEIESFKGYDTSGEKKDLKYLESLTQDDLLNILDNVLNNTNFNDYTNEIIHEKLYEYENNKGASNEE